MANVARNLKIAVDWEDSGRAAALLSKPRLTKIVCTVGPADGSGSVERLLELMHAGMNVTRLNMSHGQHDKTGEVVANFRKALALFQEAKPGSDVNLMLDTKGPEIRTGVMSDGQATLVEGTTVTVGVDLTKEGDATHLQLDYADLCSSTKVGNKILIADGSLSLQIESIDLDNQTCTTKVLNTCTIGSRKNVHLPGAQITLPALQQKDIDDLKWGIETGVDMVAASFVKTADDVRQIRRVLGNAGRHIKIMSKVETTEALTNIDEIVAESDGIMVARGDLGVEVDLDEIFLAQKMIISKCNDAHKPVVTATQMLESMISNPRPTRAEATDVANAVLDGTDCVMLSGETAMGRFPIEAVRYLHKISARAEAVESQSPFDELFLSLKQTADDHAIPETVAMYAVRMQRDLGAKLIVTITETGNTSRLVAKYRPDVPVVCVSNNPHTTKWLALTRGAYPVLVEGDSLKGRTDDLALIGIESARRANIVVPGDLVIVLSGVVSGHAGKTNRLTVVTATDV